MNEWEMTPDDMVEVLKDHWLTPHTSIAQAAQKKLLDWLKSHGYHYKPDSKHKTLSINDIVCDQECWVVVIPKE